MVHKRRLNLPTFITNNEIKYVQNLPDCEGPCDCDEALSEAANIDLLITSTS